MANALESASLVMIPSGYEDGTLGSLKPTDGTGDFTFSRGSNTSATRVNADGYIEKGYENLLTYSNDFSNAAWTPFNASVTSGQSGYDGSSDAWLLNITTSQNSSLYRSISMSGVYAKANSVGYLGIRDYSLSGAGNWFNLSNGTIASTTNDCIDAKIESVGNGWYKCSITQNRNATGFTQIGASDNPSTTSTTSGSIYIQDAMLNQGLVAYPYIETTTAPVAGGILEDMPRLDYSNGSCPALLLEPSRTNLATQSEYLEGNRKSGSISFSYNDSTSPEGITNAALVSVTGSNDRVQPRFTAINGLVCISIFLKHNGTDFTTQINAYNDGDTSLYGATARVTSSEVTFSSYQSGYDSADFVDYGNGWFRVYVVCQSTTGYTSAQWRPSVGLAISYPCYGFQVEQGSYPTSYIPTYGVSQTRLAESMVSDTSSFGITDEFTFFIDTNGALVSGTSLNTLDDLRWYTQSTNKYRFYKNSDAIFLGNSIQVNDRTKIALKITATQCKTFVDGVLHSTISLTTPFASFDTIFRGTETKVKDELNQITLFPTALTDSECIELTTI